MCTKPFQQLISPCAYDYDDFLDSLQNEPPTHPRWARPGFLLNLRLDEIEAAGQLPSGRFDITVSGDLALPVYLYKKRPASESLFVFFNGAGSKDVKIAGFNRYSWFQTMPGDCLYICDPLVLKHKGVGLAWYLGYNDNDLLAQIATLLQRLVAAHGYRRIYSYGSSGGGFTALKLAEYLRIRAIGLNSQLDCKNYVSFKEFLQGTGNQLTSEFEARTEVRPGPWSDYLIVQNAMDEHHMRSHLIPFLRKHGMPLKYGLSSKDNINIFIYKSIKGHNALDDQHFARILIYLFDRLLTADADLRELDKVFLALSEIWHLMDAISLRSAPAGK